MKRINMIRAHSIPSRALTQAKMSESAAVPANEQVVLTKIDDLVSENVELREKLAFNQEMIYTLETELSGLKKLRVLDFMSDDAHLCRNCREIKRISERQLWHLNKLFNKALQSKPKDLLYLAKLFNHLEVLIHRGGLSKPFESLAGEKCNTCQQLVSSEAFTSAFELCILEELNDLKNVPAFATSIAHVREVISKGSDQVDRIGVEPLMTKRRLSVSGNEEQAAAQQDLSTELHRNLSVGSRGKKAAGTSLLYGRQNTIEQQKDGRVVYSIGTHIKLSSYSAAPHEDPNILIKKWELELKKCGIPRCDWTLFVTRSFKETAHQWWELQGSSEDIPWEEFKARLMRAFGRVELRRWLAYAGNLCFSQANETVGPYTMRRFQIILRAVNQNQGLALKLLEKHVNMKIGRYLNFHSYEDFFFALVADQVMTFDAIKLMFSQVLLEIRNDDRYWHDLL